MEFDKSKVYTALNADESLIGAKGYFADDIGDLRDALNHPNSYGQVTLSEIKDNYIMSNIGDIWNFFYLVKPAPKKFKVIMSGALGLEIVPKNYLTTAYSECEGTKEECEQYISEHSVTLSDIGLEDKSKYRPFRNCDELIKTYKSKLNGYYDVAECPLDLPTIWIKNKYNKEISLITRFCDDSVILDSDLPVTSLKELFDNYTFLDGSICGVEE